MNDYTHIVVILDSSGSMQSILADTIGGFNTLLKTQKGQGNKATFSLYKFDTSSIFGGTAKKVYDAIYDFVDIDVVSDLDDKKFKPVGGTPLLDTIGGVIGETEMKLSTLVDSPDKVLVAIITDGEENASKSFNLQQVKDLINDKTTKNNWQFMYLGANQDAIQEATKYGISVQAAASYGISQQAVNNTYSAIGSKMSNLRSAKSFAEYSTATAYTAEERVAMMDPGLDKTDPNLAAILGVANNNTKVI